MKRSFLLTVSAISFFLLGTVEVEGCRCFGRQQGVQGVQTCGYYWTADAVFVGRAETVEVDEKNHSMKVTFSVERSIRGTNEKTVEIFTRANGGMCGYPFKQGERYFVYGRKDSEGKLSESLCGPTTLLRNAQDDLEYADDLAAGGSGARFSGVVNEDRQATINDERTRDPVANVEVTIKSNNQTLRTRTDEKGRYLFKDFPFTDYPTKGFQNDIYRAFIELPAGYREIPLPSSSQGLNGCYSKSFLLTRQGSIRGRVVGFPSASIENPWDRDPAQPKVALIPLDGRDRPRGDGFPEEWAYRDRFEYFFDRVPAGRYLVAINPNNCPYPNNGVGTMYYPGAATQVEAQIVTIKEGEQLLLNDFHSLPLLKERWIAGRVVDRDGMPVTNARVRLIIGAHGSGRCGFQDFQATSNELGQFRIKGYETYSYSIQAFSEDLDGRPKALSRIRPLPEDSTAAELVLTLDQ